MRPVLLLILACLLGTAAVAETASADRPNIIFFIADDMLPKHFNCLPNGEGRNLTPNIDRLAREGTLMMGQHVASPICTPSRYNVLTGQFASRAQNHDFLGRTGREGQAVVEFNTHIVPGQVTLQHRLQESGYETGMVGKNHVVQTRGLHRFPDFDADAREPANVAHLRENHEKVRQAMMASGFDFADRIYHNNPDFLGLHDVAVQNLDWVTEGGLEFICRPREKPFFLYFATTVPHGPTEARRSWNADPRMSAIGELDRDPVAQPARDTIPVRLEEAGLPVDEDTANILWLDDAVGALLDRLEESGQLANTVIFFFSDHGQESKGTLYQGGVHDPSIVWRAGGFPVGSRSDSLVHIVDFAPTILDLAGAPDPPSGAFDGQSFLPLLEGAAPDPDRALYFELGYTRGLRVGPWKYIAVRYPTAVAGMNRAARTKVLEAWNAERRRKHMAIVTEDPSRPFSHLTPVPGGGDAERYSTGSRPGYYDADQLYNLSVDPDEKHNLAENPEYADKLNRMRATLQSFLNELPGEFPL